MSSKFKAILTFFNLLDADGHISITNLAVWITLIKLLISPSASLTEAGSLLIALSSYAHKRYVNNKAKAQETDVQAQINSAIEGTTQQLTTLEGKVSAIALQVGISRK